MHDQGGEVVDLVELPALVVHLLPDRVEVLRPAADLRLDPDLRQLPLEDRDHLVDVRLALEATLGDALLEVDVVLRVEGPQREVLELRRSEEHTSELQSLAYLVCRLLL